MALECCSLGNPNPSSLRNVSLRPPSVMCFSSSASPFSLNWSRPRMLSAVSFSYIPIGLCGSTLLPVSNGRSTLPLPASHEDSTPLEIDVEKERSEYEQEGQESEEAWERALASFKEQALKLPSVSQEAYETYSKKAMVALKETAEQLKIEADKARYDLTFMAQELEEEGQRYIFQVSENSPEPVKDVVETFTSSTENVKDVSEIRDFYVGVPYGAILSFGGFLDFMITGSTSAIRFGVILGGILLALSVSSLRSWRKGKPTDDVIIKCETAIAGILFLRQFRLLFQKPSFPCIISTAISGAVAAFFVYRLMYDQDAKESNIDGELHI